MSSKKINLFKRVTVILVIVMMLSSSVASAYSFGGNSNTMTRSLIERFFNINIDKDEYNMKDLEIDLENMKKSGNIDMDKISELIGKLPNGMDKDILQGIKDMFTKLPDITGKIDLSALLDKLLSAIKSLLGQIGGGSSSSSLPKPTSINMESKTAVEFAGEDFKVKLNANIYMHLDENGNEDSDKWALLIHPFMLKGQTIAKNVGPAYYEKGYNIIAPDLRGFGDSEGKVAMGVLESLDVYDWLTALNDNYNVKQVIVHGISLGGATTNYLSGIDKFINEGPIKINTTLKPIKELNVIGLVEDCGYTDMTEFADKSMILKQGIGFKEEHFDYYSKATNSLKYCDLPMLIIHGTNDTTVKPENANIVKDTVKGETEQWLVDGASHAFIIMGSKKDEYKAHVQSFIDKVNGDTVQKTETAETEDRPEEKEETQNYFSRLIDAFSSLRNR